VLKKHFWLSNFSKKQTVGEEIGDLARFISAAFLEGSTFMDHPFCTLGDHLAQLIRGSLL